MIQSYETYSFLNEEKNPWVKNKKNSINLIEYDNFSKNIYYFQQIQEKDQQGVQKYQNKLYIIDPQGKNIYNLDVKFCDKTLEKNFSDEKMIGMKINMKNLNHIVFFNKNMCFAVFNQNIQNYYRQSRINAIEVIVPFMQKNSFQKENECDEISDVKFNSCGEYDMFGVQTKHGKFYVYSIGDLENARLSQNFDQLADICFGANNKDLIEKQCFYILKKNGDNLSLDEQEQEEDFQVFMIDYLHFDVKKENKNLDQECNQNNMPAFLGSQEDSYYFLFQNCLYLADFQWLSKLDEILYNRKEEELEQYFDTEANKSNLKIVSDFQEQAEINRNQFDVNNKQNNDGKNDNQLKKKDEESQESKLFQPTSAKFAKILEHSLLIYDNDGIFWSFDIELTKGFVSFQQYFKKLQQKYQIIQQIQDEMELKKEEQKKNLQLQLNEKNKHLDTQIIDQINKSNEIDMILDFNQKLLKNVERVKGEFGDLWEKYGFIKKSFEPFIKMVQGHTDEIDNTYLKEFEKMSLNQQKIVNTSDQIQQILFKLLEKSQKKDALQGNRLLNNSYNSNNNEIESRNLRLCTLQNMKKKLSETKEFLVELKKKQEIYEKERKEFFESQKDLNIKNFKISQEDKEKVFSVIANNKKVIAFLDEIYNQLLQKKKKEQQQSEVLKCQSSQF
ncbi:hypothetical protein PPERSA_07277 [Pseudocohnilembus persalinus]|uniref:Uncharacterized protein n=1 Tax=Pseudocohnilembus persalinus TaxID=266149 RepID=A0A0V0QD71_PSEPJ|nr:hypothetical protein PPERSA_07277 [Pseudocohnilembus persalinus]|eukprot:KRX00080.1 hypothetical protein PPERSA_07277 [Pseudocohnilembus persalinus]